MLKYVKICINIWLIQKYDVCLFYNKKIDMETQKKLSLAHRMSALKKELSSIKMPKSGENKYIGFKYHELQDF